MSRVPFQQVINIWKKLRYFVLFFFNIYTKSKESGAYFLLITPFQAPGSHMWPVTTILDSTARDTLMKTQSKSGWHISISGHKHSESISIVPCLKSNLSRLIVSTPQLEHSPRSPQLEKAPCSSDNPVQPKWIIFFFFNECWTWKNHSRIEFWWSESKTSTFTTGPG